MLRKRQPRREGWACLAIALVALATSAVAPSGASALPELLYCMESATGKYETMAKCEALDETGAGTLKWEWESGPLTGEEVLIDFSSGVGSLNTSKHHIECLSSSGSGMVKGANELSAITITFKECVDTAFGTSCNSTEPAGGEGEILTKELTAEMVYLKATKQTPGGILLLPPAGQPFTKISCVGGLIKESVTGEVIGELTSGSINSMITTGELKYEENGLKEQLWRKVEEGAAVHELTAFGEKAYEVGKETFELLVGGSGKKSELMF